MSFGEEYIRTRGAPILHEGRTVVPALQEPVQPGQVVGFRWLRAIPSPPQGIRIELKEGLLVVNGEEVKSSVVWRETSPDEFEFVCKCKRPTELTVWNCWKDTRGTMQAWIGNAGMSIDRSVDGRVIEVHANSRHEITFQDSVFELRFGQP